MGVVAITSLALNFSNNLKVFVLVAFFIDPAGFIRDLSDSTLSNENRLS